MHLENVVLPNKGPNERFSVEIEDGRIKTMTKLTNNPKSLPALLLPALCHPHVHLDKAFILNAHSGTIDDTGKYPDYSDLGLESGEFKEALSKTAEAKKRYTDDDIRARASHLIVESLQAGVTSMRAFVEIDHVTKFTCIQTAQRLQHSFEKLCRIQICAFAQDPIMSTEFGEENRRLLEQALDDHQTRGTIQALGTTPYVEESIEHGIQNMTWAIEAALQRKLHLDFHLDYNLDPQSKPLIWDAIRLLKEARWTERAEKGKTIVFGHCTRLTLFSDEEMERLTAEIADLPVSFVGLPTSDLFMMGRPSNDKPGYGQRSRGTLQVVDMIQKNGLQACIGINNAGNAFTPWGSIDPLRLACLGVGLYHAGTDDQARLLYECVSTRARRAIGLQTESSADDFDLTRVDAGGILAITNDKRVWIPGMGMDESTDQGFLARPKLSVNDIVWDPPELRLRSIVRSKG